MGKYLFEANYTAEGAKGIAKDGGSAIEAPVRIESAPARFDVTVVTYKTHDSKTAIFEN